MKIKKNSLLLLLPRVLDIKMSNFTSSNNNTVKPILSGPPIILSGHSLLSGSGH